jgi:hypothetical protein
MSSDEEVAIEVVKVHNFMNMQYASFRSLWISFDLFAVSIGLWLFVIILAEILISLTTFGNNGPASPLRSVLFLLLRLLLATLPFMQLQNQLSEIQRINIFMGLLIASTYVLELKLYDFRLFKRALIYVFVEHKSQLKTNLAPLWALGVFLYGAGADSMRE